MCMVFTIRCIFAAPSNGKKKKEEEEERKKGNHRTPQDLCATMLTRVSVALPPSPAQGICLSALASYGIS